MWKICRESWLCLESGNGEGSYYWVPFELFRLKYAFSQEKKTLQFLLHNSFALIITKCGSICLCTCDGCQQHWKAVSGGGKRRKKVFSYVCWSRAQWSISDARVQIIALLLCLFLWISKVLINKLVGEQWFCILNSVIASSQWDCALLSWTAEKYIYW